MSDVTYLKAVDTVVATKVCARCGQARYADAVKYRWQEHPRRRICLDCFEVSTREHAEYLIAIARDMASAFGD